MNMFKVSGYWNFGLGIVLLGRISDNVTWEWMLSGDKFRLCFGILMILGGSLILSEEK